MLRGAHFLCESGLVQDRLRYYKYTRKFVLRLLSSGWELFQSTADNSSASTDSGSSTPPGPPPPPPSGSSSLPIELGGGPSFKTMMCTCEDLIKIFGALLKDPMAAVCLLSFSY